MIQKTLESINKNDLQSLIKNAVLEKKTLDYKEKFSGNTDDDKREFLKDITSFANSSGGDIIYGIREDNGVPVELTGIPNEEVDSKILWIEDLVRQGVQPRIPNIKIQPIDIGDSTKAIILRIPKSWRSPHCVTFKNWSRFFARSSNGVYQLDVDELRGAFILSSTLDEKIQNFKNDRIANIIAEEIPFKLYCNSNIILHIIPLSAFDITSEKIDIKEVLNNEKFMPIYTRTSSRRINFDGLIITSETNVSGKSKVITYTQLYKNGIIEAVESSLLSYFEGDKKFIPYFVFEDELIKSAKKYVDLLKEQNIELPYLFYITLVGIKGYEMPSSSMFFRSTSRIERDILSPEVVMLEDFNTEIDVLFKPIFDSIWNACGFAQSIDYDENGRFKPK